MDGLSSMWSLSLLLFLSGWSFMMMVSLGQPFIRVVFQQGGFSPQWSHMGSSMSFKWHRMDFLPHPETERDDSLYIEQSHQINSANSVDISLTQILHMHACMHACTHTTYTYTTHTHTLTRHYITHPPTHTQTHSHTLHTHTYIYTHTHPHTQTNKTISYH